MTATKQYFPVVLFTVPYKVILTVESVDEMGSVTIQMKTTQQYFPVSLLIMLLKLVVTFESLDEMEV